MTKKLALISIVFCLVTVLAGCCFDPFTHTVELGKNRCVTVYLPATPSRSNGNIQFRIEQDNPFEFRAVANSPGIFLVAIRDDGHNFDFLGPYSDQKFRVNLRSGTATIATDSEWNAESVAQFSVRNSLVPREFLDSRNRDWALHPGFKEYAMFGKRLPPTFPYGELMTFSADTRWIAIPSWDGEKPLVSAATEGRYAVDIYEVRTAKKVVLVRGSFCGGNLEGYIRGSGWLEDKFYIQPTNVRFQSFLACEMN